MAKKYPVSIKQLGETPLEDSYFPKQTPDDLAQVAAPSLGIDLAPVELAHSAAPDLAISLTADTPVKGKDITPDFSEAGDKPSKGIDLGGNPMASKAPGLLKSALDLKAQRIRTIRGEGSAGDVLSTAGQVGFQVAKTAAEGAAGILAIPQEMITAGKEAQDLPGRVESDTGEISYPRSEANQRLADASIATAMTLAGARSFGAPTRGTLSVGAGPLKGKPPVDSAHELASQAAPALGLPAPAPPKTISFGPPPPGAPPRKPAPPGVGPPPSTPGAPLTSPSRGFVANQEDRLHQLRTSADADVAEALQFVKKLPPDIRAHDAALYHSVENPTDVLAPRAQELKTRYLEPLKQEERKLTEELRQYNLPGVDTGPLNPNYQHRIVKGKAPQFDDIVGGASSNPIYGGRQMSTKPSSTKERRVFAIEDAVGNRKVVTEYPGGDAVHIWEAGKPPTKVYGGFLRKKAEHQTGGQTVEARTTVDRPVVARPSGVKERKIYALVDDAGNRKVVTEYPGGDGVRVWENGKETRVYGGFVRFKPEAETPGRVVPGKTTIDRPVVTKAEEGRLNLGYIKKGGKKVKGYETDPGMGEARYVPGKFTPGDRFVDLPNNKEWRIDVASADEIKTVPAHEDARIDFGYTKKSKTIPEHETPERRVPEAIVKGEFKPGDIFVTKHPQTKGPPTDKQWEIKQATTREIEGAGVRGSDGTPLKYYPSAIATTTENVLNLRRAVRNARYLEELKGAPEFKQFAVHMGNEAIPKGWRPIELPQLRGYYAHPRIANAVNDFYKGTRLLEGSAADLLTKVNNLAVGSIFWNPLIHGLNVTDHWIVSRGWDWATPKGLKSLMVDGPRAIKEVITQGPKMLEFMREGGSMIAPGIRNRKFVDTMLRKLGQDITKNPAPWKQIADGLGLGVPQLVKLIYEGSARTLWMWSDVLMLQRYMELERQGLSKAKAIEEAEHHIPPYRVPSEVAGNVIGQRAGRALSQIIQDPNVTAFGRYHYGQFHAFTHMVKSLVKGDLKSKWKTVGNLVALGFMMTVIYPLLLDRLARAVTGNEHATFRRRGASSVVQMVIDLLSGRKDLEQITENVFTPAPGSKEILQQFFNREFFKTKDNTIREGNVVQQIYEGGRHALGATVAPIGLARQAYKNGLDRVLQSQVGIDNPTAQQRRFREDQPFSRRDAQSRARRDLRREQNLPGPVRDLSRGVDKLYKGFSD